MDKDKIRLEIKEWFFDYQKAHHKRTALELRAKRIFMELLKDKVLE